MNQIVPLLVYLGAALVVPVLIARFILRAEWRMVRNACIIWYSLLVLIFGGPFKPEALGWAMIFAMYFSILAIPLLSLILKLGSFVWTRFGRPLHRKPSP